MTQGPFVLADWVRARTRGIMQAVGLAVGRAGIHPDTITIAGLGVVAAAALVLAGGAYQTAGLVLLLGLPLDALDGAVARAMQRTGPFGGILDSTLDRFADAFIFAGLSYHFAVLDRFDHLLLAQAALVGSLLVSYVRARAGEAGVSVRIGLMDRMVRIVVILLMLLVPALLTPGLWLLAVGTNFTALQRLWYVRQVSSS